VLKYKFISHSANLGFCSLELTKSVAPSFCFQNFLVLVLIVFVESIPYLSLIAVILIGVQEERETNENVQSVIFTQKSLPGLQKDLAYIY
jgi:hypothetical protein